MSEEGQNRAPLWRDATGWHLDARVRGVADDSRSVRAGEIFVAIRGHRADGHRHIAEAVARGAIAVVGEEEPAAVGELPVPYVKVAGSRLALAELAATYHAHPARSLTLVGVTGTNGKTTVSHWIRHFLSRQGLASGLISSVAVKTGGATRYQPQWTTPPAPKLQALLAEMRDHGLTHAVIEVSSHALDQERVGGMRFRLAVLTNVTRDHLDYHGTMEAYAATKQRLFAELSAEAVINGDDGFGARWLRQGLPVPAVSYGLQTGMVRAELLAADGAGSLVRICGLGHPFTARIAHPGAHNVYNALAAAAAAFRLGVTPAVIRQALETLPAIPGRLELVERVDGVSVVIDYAHTPDGLTQALRAARAMAGGGRVWLVFGARGDRDRGKRPEMGAVAARLADVMVVTTDSPGTEDPAAIAEAVTAGAVAAGTTPRWIPDRRRAVQWAVANAQPGDLVLVTGRGPETHINLGGRWVRLSDRELVRRAATLRRMRPRGGSVPCSSGGVLR